MFDKVLLQEQERKKIKIWRECFEKARVYLYSSFDFDHYVYGYNRYSKRIFRPYSSCGHRACLFYAYGKFLVHRSGSLFVFKDICSYMGLGI